MATATAVVNLIYYTMLHSNEVCMQKILPVVSMAFSLWKYMQDAMDTWANWDSYASRF